MHDKLKWVLLLGLGACAGMSSRSATVTSMPAPSASMSAYGGPQRGGETLAPTPAPQERPGLGTAWGEQVESQIQYTKFERASVSPWAMLAMSYNDAEGVAAQASYLGVTPEPIELTTGDGALSMALVDEHGRMLPGYTAAGRTLVVGEDHERYKIVVRNTTQVRFEVVASVDGLDVIDGKPADPQRRGYIVDPHSSLVIDGFRTSDDQVAAFRLGTVDQSYAAQTSGDRNVGVVGFAVFAEKGAVWSRRELERRDTANPFPNRSYSVAPN